jgi:hypothetical protein
MGATKFADGTPTKFGRRLAITLPDYLFDWIKKEALEGNRSMSAQIVHLLETYVPKAERKVLEREGIEWNVGR